MNTILIKLFATALTLSQVTTRPDALRTRFDPETDGPEVVRILRDGCAHMRKAFDIEDINLDDLIATAMEDPSSVAGASAPKILHGLDLNQLNTSYKQFCKGEDPPNSPFDAHAVIEFYDNATKDLPAAETLRDKALPGMSRIVDASGKPFAETFEPNARRLVVPIESVPPLVQKAFIAAEDKRFETHHGIDERGVIRAFVANLAAPGRPAGGSTITQQVVKNLSVGDDVTYERKIREMIVAARLERIMSKSQILGLYLNGIYLGRGAYGVEMAAQSYFGKSVGDLTLPEAALLAGMPKGPNFYSPDKYPDRARERRAYVLSRLKEEGVINDAEMAKANAADLGLKPFETARRDSGFYLVDYLSREARTVANLDTLTSASFTVHATVNAGLQRAVETALQDGLANYERATGRQSFSGPEANLADSIHRIAAAAPSAGASPQAAPPVVGAGTEAARTVRWAPSASAVVAGKPAWLRALESVRPALYDVHWPLAVVLDAGRGAVKVGLSDGRIATLDPGIARGRLQRYDVVRVKLSEGRGAPRAQIRLRPTVQGAALVLENRTGRVLAMAGGFSYPMSQLNRVTQAVRQPGSTLKPLTYLAALNAGLQPNTLVLDAPVTLPPIGGVGESWSPKNYDGGGSGPTTLRRGLEFSKNLVTAHLLEGGIAPKAPASLKRVCDIALEAQIYAECEPYYPFVLGAQPVRMLDLAGFYAAVANEGARPSPYVLESVEREGKTVYAHTAREPVRIGSADRVAFYQLKTMLQGVTQHGTAAALAKFSGSVAGKTGTSENENDAWFAGFSNEITVVVWVGYDNADGTRKTLGRGQTGGHVAVPIAGAIFQAAWANGVPRTPLRGPSPEAKPFIADVVIDPRSGQPGAGAFVEHFRKSPGGQVAETRYKLVPRETLYAMRPDGGDGDLAGDEGADARGDYYGNMTSEGPRPDLLDPFGDRTTQRSRRAGADPSGSGYGGGDDPYPPWPGQASRSPFGDDDPGRRPNRRDPDYLFDDDPGY